MDDGLVLLGKQEHPDSAQGRLPLRACGKRPSGGAASKRDEIAPSHAQNPKIAPAT
jgi:hypothetical protein